MMMRNTPFISALGDKHGKSRRPRNWFVIDHPGKSVKTGDDDRVIVDYDCAVRRSSIVFLLPLPFKGVK